MRKIFFFTLFCISVSAVNAQELQAKVTVLAAQIGTQVNKNTFTTLQEQLTNLINNRSWTKDVFQASEKIQCNFLLNVQKIVDDNVYSGTLTIQAARPIYSSSYQSALVNFQDADVTFKYVQYQPVEFNENNVGGSDGLAANLTATIAFYVYMILGLDYDSFGLKEGEDYFKKAQNIVSNAPEARNISGWKPFDGTRNRYWLATNINNPKFNILHDFFYSYYRNGMDNMYQDENSARANIMNALGQLQDFNQQNPNTMILQFFMQGRSAELIGIFKKAAPPIKARAADVLSKLDVANAAKYRAEIR